MRPGPGIHSLSGPVSSYLCGGVSTSRGEESSDELSDESSDLLGLNIEGADSSDSGSIFVFDPLLSLTFFNPALSSSSIIFSSSYLRFHQTFKKIA